LLADINVLDGHVQRFLAAYPMYASWHIEKVSIAPLVPAGIRTKLELAGHIPQDLVDLTAELR
jgi:hypothetical protein